MHPAEDALGATMGQVQPTGGLTSLLNWRAVMLGFLTAVALGLALGAVGARSGLENNLGAAASLEFIALLAGGYVAGRLADGSA
jgi:hypothetical protein